MTDRSQSPDPDATRTSGGRSGHLPAGTRLAGRYTVRELVGAGGMGIVYRAWDEELRHEVGLKVLRPALEGTEGFTERFRRELLLARQVSHPNVVRIHDIGQHDDLRFLTMDFVAGVSLRQLLADEGPLAPERAAEIVRQLAAGLGAAHARGIVHRDLKPSNVLVDEAGNAYVTDFGVARSLEGTKLTRSGAVVGSVDYLSPEQARGEPVDGRSDLYALGLLLHEMLTGELPFAGGSWAETLAQRIHGAPRDPGELDPPPPPALARLLRRCLAREPGERYATAEELIRDLDAPPPGRLRRRGIVAGLLAAALLVVALLGVALYRQAADRPAAPAAAERAAEAAVRPARHAVAVLPFTDQTGSEDLEWLGQALAELLAERLAEVPQLRVVDGLRVARTVEDLRLAGGRPSDSSLTQLGEVFDVDRLLVGTVRAPEGRLRVDLEMVSLTGAGQLERERLEPRVGHVDELDELTVEVAGAARRALDLPTGPGGAAGAAGGRPGSRAPRRAAAEGARLLERGNALAASPRLEQAVETDPEFAAAWARLAEARARLGYAERARDALERATRLLDEPGGRLAIELEAQRALLEGQPQRAQEALRELVERYPYDVEAALQLADAYTSSGDLASARRVLERVTTIDSNHPRAWYLLAKTAILLGDARRAVDDYLVRALVIQNQLRNRQGRADVLNAFGVAYGDLGDLDLAEENYEQAAELRREIGDRRGGATTLRNLAQIAIFRGDFSAARQDLLEALDILEEIGDPAGVADLHNDLGILEEERGDPAAALEAYRHALKLRRELGDDRAEAESLNNVGFAYYLLGEYDNARVYWRNALDLYRSAGNPEGIVLTTQSLGQLELAQGHWSRALELFHDSLERSREEGYRDTRAVALGHLGKVAHHQGRYAAALASLDDALELVAELEDLRGLVEFSLVRAAVRLDLGRREEADADLERAEGWLAEAENPEQRTELLRLRGELQRSGGGLDEARASVEAALAQAEESGSPRALLAARLARGHLALAEGRPGEAAGELSEVLAASERLGHAWLELRAAEALARARLAAGDTAAAAAALGRAKRRMEETGPYVGAQRLLALEEHLARQGGRQEEAERAAARRAEELARIAGGLDRAAREHLAGAAEER